MTHTFGITENAARRITQLVAPGDFFKVVVLGGGCSGFQYEFDFKAQKEAGDIEFCDHNVVVLVDEISLPYVENSVLDYEEDLGSAKFVVKNPNATAKCGCGKSFSV